MAPLRVIFAFLILLGTLLSTPVAAAEVATGQDSTQEILIATLDLEQESWLISPGDQIDNDDIPAAGHDLIPSSEALRWEFEATPDCNNAFSYGPNGWGNDYEETDVELRAVAKTDMVFSSRSYVWVVLEYEISIPQSCNSDFYFLIDIYWYLNQTRSSGQSLHYEHMKQIVDYNPHSSSNEYEYCNVYLERSSTPELGSESTDGCNPGGPSFVTNITGPPFFYSVEISLFAELWADNARPDGSSEIKAGVGRIMHNARVVIR